MPSKKYTEFLNHLFVDILKKPMMSEYCCYGRYRLCSTSHIGWCRYICRNCNDVRYVHACKITKKVTPFNRIRELVKFDRYSWWRKPISAEILRNPECNSCEFAKKWKKSNWEKYVEKAIFGGRDEGKELRRIFYDKDKIATIRTLLTFFNCSTVIPMRDSLISIIKYSYYW